MGKYGAFGSLKLGLMVKWGYISMPMNIQCIYNYDDLFFGKKFYCGFFMMIHEQETTTRHSDGLLRPRPISSTN